MIARLVARLIAAARSPLGRLVAVAAGMGGVALILHRIGFDVVTGTLAGAASGFPIVLALEAGVIACTMRSLLSLYGEAGRTIPRSQLVRTGLIGYAVMGLVPAGRAVAEVTRASLLARWVGAGRAAAAAGRLQATSLLTNGIISVLAALAALSLVGPSWLVLAIAGNAALCLTLGLGVLFAASRSRVGAWLGRHIPAVRSFGAALDEALEGEPVLPRGAIAWELAGRCFQTAQNGVILVCVGGALSLRGALTSEGIHLVGAAVGDLVPAQIGVQEGNFTLAARALSLPASGAVAIALLAHLSQLTWVLVGSLVPLVWPALPAPLEVAAESPAPPPVAPKDPTP